MRDDEIQLGQIYRFRSHHKHSTDGQIKVLEKRVTDRGAAYKKRYEFHVRFLDSNLPFGQRERWVRSDQVVPDN